MEIVSPISFCAFLFSGEHPITSPLLLFCALWVIHYLNRAIVQPLRARSLTRRIPASVVLMAIVFNAVNGFVVGYGLGHAGRLYDADWFAGPAFLAGIVLFAAGAFTNLHSDAILMRLKKAQSGSYGIPRGGLFRLVSTPNYLGEIVEWMGFAVMTWSLPALSFAIWTAANLIPRALAHHRWYLTTFSDYPANRRAVLPGLL
jgi:3-oxo-5-alpha-steroid 4-dehydrogenase 1